MPNININADATVVYAAKLESMSRSALPIAVRRTLNSAVLDVKSNTMIAQSDKAFKKRKPSFFRATSAAEMAQGLDISSMRGVVGFVAPTGVKESGYATKDLEEQEEGGSIDKRAFIATNAGRTAAGNVRDNLRMSVVKHHIIDADKMVGGMTRGIHGGVGRGQSWSMQDDAQKFVAAAVKVGFGGNGAGGLVIGTDRHRNGSRGVYMILGIKRVGRDMKVKSKEVYTVRGGRQAHVKPTHFMNHACVLTAKKMEYMFIKHAQTAINK